MIEVKDAPKPKTTNGKGQTNEVAPQVPTIPQRLIESPFIFMRRFAEDMDRFFKDFGFESRWHIPRIFTPGRKLLRTEAGVAPTVWAPLVDVLEREGQFIVRVDLPGLSKEEIGVEVTDELLTIHGERKHEKKEEREGYHYSECSYGSFYRAIPLPEGVDNTKATAEFHKGVLEVVMPRTMIPAPSARRLEVREVK
jgi:HSP20 family protein